MLPITKLPTASLRERSRELTREELLSPEIQELIAMMVPTMYAAEGIGLAAPQVGRNIRLFTIGKDAVPGKAKNLVFVNAVWTKNTRKTLNDHEGCLSVPKQFGKVKRYADIHVEAWDEQGNPVSFDAKDFFARVIQHEVDHLNGTLFVDKATDFYESD